MEDTIQYAPEENEEESTGTENAGDTGVTGENRPPWMDFEKDPVTGYLIAPDTGELLDPETGDPIEGDYPAIQ